MAITLLLYPNLEACAGQSAYKTMGSDRDTTWRLKAVSAAVFCIPHDSNLG